MKCAYCGKETKGTKEHIISSAILDLFPECYLTFDDIRKKTYSADPVIKDVCAECNNHRISYIDSYAKDFIGRYFVKKYKEDISFFTEEVRSFLMNEDDKIPKNYVSVFCGIAVNVSPLPDAAM